MPSDAFTKNSRARPFDQCLGSKHLFKTKVTQEGRALGRQADRSKLQWWTWCSNSKYLLSSSSGPGALLDPENSGREQALSVPWWDTCCVTLGK